MVMKNATHQEGNPIVMDPFHFDAGLAREWIAYELVECNRRGGFGFERTNTFHRRIARLAYELMVSRKEIWQQAEKDAKAILENDAR